MRERCHAKAGRGRQSAACTASTSNLRVCSGADWRSRNASSASTRVISPRRTRVAIALAASGQNKALVISSRPSASAVAHALPSSSSTHLSPRRASTTMHAGISSTRIAPFSNEVCAFHGEFCRRPGKAAPRQTVPPIEIPTRQAGRGEDFPCLRLHAPARHCRTLPQRRLHPIGELPDGQDGCHRLPRLVTHAMHAGRTIGWHHSWCQRLTPTAGA